MKFLSVPGGLVESPNDDIHYEIQMHESTMSICAQDTQIGFSVVHDMRMLAVVLHPLPGKQANIVKFCL